MPRRFAGKVVIVTASTAGIGLGIATRLAQEGARVMISSRWEPLPCYAVLCLERLTCLSHCFYSCTLNLIRYTNRRKKQNVDEVVSQLKAQGLDVAGCACHVGNKQQRQQLVQETVRVRPTPAAPSYAAVQDAHCTLVCEALKGC